MLNKSDYILAETDRLNSFRPHLGKTQSASLGKLSIKLKLLVFVLFSSITFFSQASYVYATSPQEAEILHLTNKERKKAGLKPLKINYQLMQVARAQSSIMAHKRCLSHSVNGKSLIYRIKKSGYPYKGIGENISQSSSARRTIKMWMKSSGHRANILKRNFKEIGIAVAIAPNGDKYYTQVFGTR